MAQKKTDITINTQATNPRNTSLSTSGGNTSLSTSGEGRGEVANSTTYSDKPIVGGQEQIVINQIQIRQAVVTHQSILSWRAAYNAAISRYFPNRTRLYDIYEDTKLDGHLTGIVQKRIDSVLNKPLFYKDANGEVIGEMQNTINSAQFRFIMKTILDTQLYGISGLEFLPGKDLQARLIPRKHIKTKTQKISIEQNDQDTGIDYTVLDNVWIIGGPEDLGLFLQCSQYVIYKRGAMGDWANFIEIFGQPIRVAKYDAQDKQTKEEVKEALDNTGSSLALLIPNTVDLTLLDSKTAASNGELQKNYVELLNEELSKLILGNTETTGGGKSGSLAKSKTHAEQQNEILKSDISYLECWLNEPRFIKILQSYNFPVKEGACFEFNKDIDILFLSERSLIDTALIKAGAKVGNKYIQETYNIPPPEPGDEITTQQPQVIETEDGDIETGEAVTVSKPNGKKKKVAKAPDLADLIDQRLKAFFDHAL